MLGDNWLINREARVSLPGGSDKDYIQTTQIRSEIQ